MARPRKAGAKPSTRAAAKAGGGAKRRIEQYDHMGQQRRNNPPVGLVTEATDRDAPKRRYAYDPPSTPAIDFYQHAHAWSNRLIAGDSLLVMNSLLEKEGMAGKVQMVYIDPPYGIRYGSNFQPFVNKRDVKDGSDEDLTQEPEMIRAFRDTWELGFTRP